MVLTLTHDDIADLKQSSHEAFVTLRKESLDIFNRLQSIEEDIGFVNHVHDQYQSFPLVPNLRCGAWYTDPARACKTPAYFKSTDGHIGNWSFNLRRANLHLLPLIYQSSGLILVDSTRAGKRMPDALSKTVPIWCAVVNRAISIRRQRLGLDSNTFSDWDSQLYTPPGVVSAQEHHQIAEKLDGWAKTLADSSFEIPLEFPVSLRPLWISPSTTTFPVLHSNPSSRGFLPIICVSASKQVEAGAERRVGGFAYVQGSGDDHELWGMGLTPQDFWRHRRDLVSATRTELEDLIRQIFESTSFAHNTSLTLSTIAESDPPPAPVFKIHGRIQLASFSASRIDALNISLRSKALEESEAAYIILDFSPSTNPSEGAAERNMTESPSPSRQNILHILASQKTKIKADAYFLQQILPLTVPFIKYHLYQRASTKVCIFEGCGNDAGTRLDISVGIALVAIQLFFDKDGQIVREGHEQRRDKQSIRKRLEWIIESEPRVNPSRATLKRVNEFLLTPSVYQAH